MTHDVPEPRSEPLGRSLLERFSIVWVVPLGALLISLGIAWQSYSERGPLISIAFQNASGVQAGETELRYREVTVGLVEDVRFSDDLAHVVVDVRLDKDVAPYVDEDSEFWVVRPQVNAQGVSGLGTVLSGVYIEGSWDSEPNGLSRDFEGLLSPPIARPGQEGLRLTLSSVSGKGLLEGTPILFRGVQVGSVAHVRLSEDGVTVLADAFVEAPYDKLVTDATRFWDTAGFTFTLGPEGAQLDVSSLAALVSGGVAFDRLVSGGEPVEDGVTFELFADQDTAQASIFSDPEEGERVFVSIIFTGDVAGLSAGSPVDLRGVRVGEVIAITGYVDEARFGDRRVRLLATAELRPDKLGVPGEPGAEETYAFIDELVASGVRAQLARGNILTGGLKINLVEILEPEPASFDRDAEPYPVLPSIQADLPDVAATAEGVFRRLNELPIEELLNSALAIMENVEVVVASDAVRAAPDEALGLITDLRGIVAAPEMQTLPGQVGAILQAAETATTDISTLLADMREAGTIAALTTTLESSARAAEAIATMTDDLVPAFADIPVLTERLVAVADQVAALPLAALVTDTAETVTAARALIDDPALRAAAPALTETLQSARDTLAEVQSQDLVGQASRTLATAQDTAAAVTTATAQLPALVDRARATADSAASLLASIGDLPLDRLVTDASDLVQSANTLVGAPETQRIPQALADALTGVEATLADLRASGIIDTASAALQSADSAARAVSTATDSVPALIEQLGGLATTAEAAVQTVNTLPLTELATEATATATALRTFVASPDLQAMPAEVTSLVNALEATIADLRAADLVASTDAALTSADAAARAVEEAVAGVPALVEDVSSLAATANALPLDELVRRATGVAEAADSLLSAEGAEDLPTSLNAALDEFQGALAELREGELIANATATLASTERAADAVAEATATLPDLVARLDRLAAQASITLDAYGAEGPLPREARTALREVQSAARSISSLARTIERNPNSLLLGR